MAGYRLPCKVNENWKPLQEWNGKTKEIVDWPDYFVSDYGRMCHKINGKYKLMKLTKDTNGYLTCNIGKLRKRVHRLVASTFIPIPDITADLVVDHYNNDKTDNRLNNLHWVTPKENTQLAYDDGIIAKREKLNVFVVNKNKEAQIYGSQREAAEGTGVDAKSINKVVRGMVSQASGLRFITFRGEIEDKRGKNGEKKADA